MASFKDIIPVDLNGIRVVSSVNEHAMDCVFNDVLVAAVFVCSTTGSHYEIVKRAIEHGTAPISENEIPLFKTLRACLARGASIRCSKITITAVGSQNNTRQCKGLRYQESTDPFGFALLLNDAMGYG